MTSPGPDAAISCLIVDDHPAILAAVSKFLAEREITVTGTATTAKAGRRLAAALAPMVAIVDLHLPDADGLELACELTRSGDIRVVLYTAEAIAGVIRDAIAADISAIVRKDAPLTDLLRAIEAAANRQRWIDPSFTASLLSKEIPASLSSREREVLALLADGRSYAAIAAQLGIGSETVRTHARNAMHKLDADTKAAAVATALRRGTIS